MIKANYWKKVLLLMVLGAIGCVGVAQAQTHTEDFESGYNLGQNIGSHPDWYDGGAGPTVTSGIGVVGSVGLSPANNIFNWVAHPFSWSEVTKVIIRMDFQTDGNGRFDDDRCGWTINSGSVNSADFFGTQLDHPDGGIVTYWRNSSGSRVQTAIVAFGDLKASTWYRFRNEMTKLTATSARLDVSLDELDAAGNPIGSPLTGTVGDTSVWPGGAPDTKYFTASTIWPAYKNYSALAGSADNAYFEIVPAAPVPTVTLVSPADESLVKTTDVSFTCSATCSDCVLEDATLYVGVVPVTVAFSGADKTDDAQLYATDDSSTPEVEDPDTKAGAAANINVDGDNPHAHAVIKFLNVFGGGAGPVPSGSTIVSATLEVYCSNFGSMMKLYRLKEDWTEGEVTWNERSSGVAWTDGGADGPTSNAGAALDGDCTATGWRTMDITQFVQEWSYGAENFGIVLTDSGGSDGVDFDSSESVRPPVLTVTYGESGLQPKGTQSMSGSEHTVTFDSIPLADEQDYVWNCLVRNTSLLESWASADFHLTVNTQYPDMPILVQPVDGATDVSTSPTLEVTVSDPQGEAMNVTFYGLSGGSGADEFTIIVLPDTQNYCEFPANTYIFTEQTQWIVDNIATRNIVFVTHEGDIVENPGSTTEYDRARDSMSVLDPGLANLSDTMLPDPLVAYGVGPGNHDTPTGPPPSGYYNEYFPYTHYENRGLSWYGGHWPATGNDNNYQVFSAGGMDFIVVHLEYNPGSTIDDPAIGWADGVLKAHPDRMAIITTHAYIGTSANLLSEGTGIWNVLVQDNDNVYFVLCGHIHGEARRTDVVNGREVHQVLADYQSRPNGGNGWLRIMRFVPAEDKVYVETYSPHLDQYETDGDSQFTLDFTMNWFTSIGTNMGVASGSNASVVWSDLLLGKEHAWFVEVTDTAEHTQVGPTWSFTTIDNPQQASNPNPENGATGVDINADLTWTAGEGAESHDVYFGTVFPFPPMPPPFNQTETTYYPGTLEEGVTYYWRIDEKNGAGTTIGTVWSFTTYIPAPGVATPVNPPDGATDVGVEVILRWLSGERAASHDVYFGTSFDLVNYADNTSPEFKGNNPLEEVTWDPAFGAGDLPYESTYYWRIDEINPGGVTKGVIWSFITESDTEPPIFTYLKAIFITAHEATITWTTNELSDSLVEYSTDGISYGESVYDGNEVTLHSVTLTGLQPSTDYYYRATSTDQAEPGNPHTEYPYPLFFTTLENTPPVAADDSAATVRDVPVVIDVLANDSDFDGDTLSVGSVTQGTDGSVVDNGNGTVTYTPNGAAPYIDTFQYTINDGYLGTDSATVTVTVDAPGPTTLFSDGFESGSLATGGWTSSGSVAIKEPAAYEGVYGVQIGGTASIVKSVSTVGFTDIHVKYARKTRGMDSGEFLTVEWFDGTNWIVIEDTQDTAWAQMDIDLVAEAGENAAFSVRFRTNANKTNEYAVVDSVEIIGTPSGPDLDAPTPDPMTWAVAPQATGSTSISMTATTASDASGVEYYFACITDAAHDSSWQDSPIYEDTGLTPSTPYTYAVQARDKSPNQNLTGWSSLASATPTDVPPAAPTGLAATAGDGQVSLDWDDNGETDLAGYNVYRSETSTGPYTLLNGTLLPTSDYVDLAVTNGVTYYYVVTAVDQTSNESDISNEASATPGSQPEVYVENIAMGYKNAGRNYFGQATVWIKDETGADVEGATVSGQWSGAVSGAASGVTGPDGKVMLQSAKNSGGTLTFTVTDVVASGYVYNLPEPPPSGSISVP